MRTLANIRIKIKTMYCNVQNKRRKENEKRKKLNTNGEPPTRLLLTMLL